MTKQEFATTLAAAILNVVEASGVTFTQEPSKKATRKVTKKAATTSKKSSKAGSTRKGGRLPSATTIEKYFVNLKGYRNRNLSKADLAKRGLDGKAVDTLVDRGVLKALKSGERFYPAARIKSDQS